MALGALTLSVTAGVQGRPFSATIGGLTTGKVEVMGDGSPGFSVVNGRVISSSLPYAVSTVALREYEPGVGSGYRDSRIEISAIGAPVASTATDGSISYTVPGAGSAISIAPATIDPAATGLVAQLAAGLTGTVTYNKLSGASSIAIAAAGGVTLSAALGTGTAMFVARAQNTAGDAIEKALTLSAGSVVTPLPTVTLSPAITGTAQEGQILSVSNGTWSNSPTGYTYQWNRGGVAIIGSINATRTLTAADIGAVITCTVTATNAGGSASATSAGTAAVIAATVALPANTVAPAVTGSTTVGSLLTSDTGTWSNSPTSYAYTWRRDGVDISGATASSYTLVSADAGHSITCRVFATNAGGTAGATSNAVAVGASAGSTTNTLAASRAHIPSNAVNAPDQRTYRMEHWSSPEGAISNLQFVDVGFCLSTATAGSTASGSRTIKRYVEYPEGVFTQVLWGGAPTVVIGANATTKSDAVAGLSIPAGTRFWTRAVLVGAATSCPHIYNGMANPQDGYANSDLGNTGAASSFLPTNLPMGPASIIGTVAKAGARAAVCYGDSRVAGQGDTASVGARGGTGWLERLLETQFPLVKIAKPGQAAVQFAAANAAIQGFLDTISGTYTDGIIQVAGNDFGSRTDRTISQIMADRATIANKLPSAQRIYYATIEPSTTSSNSWADAAGQTPSTLNNWPMITDVNTAIRAVAGVRIIEAADAAMTARNSNIWSSPFPPTADGIHETSPKYAAMATALAGSFAL